MEASLIWGKSSVKKMTKQDTRKHILKIRNSLSKYEVVSAGEDIISDIDEMIIKNGSMLLLAYMPLGNEIDLTPLFKRILSGYYKEKYDIDIVLGLPRICKKEMKFFRVKSLYDLYNLKKSSFGILEPDENCEEITA